MSKKDYFGHPQHYVVRSQAIFAAETLLFNKKTKMEGTVGNVVEHVSKCTQKKNFPISKFLKNFAKREKSANVMDFFPAHALKRGSLASLLMGGQGFSD